MFALKFRDSEYANKYKGVRNKAFFILILSNFEFNQAQLFGRRANAKIFGLGSIFYILLLFFNFPFLEFEAEDEDEDNKLILAFEADYAAEVAEKALESAALDKAVEVSSFIHFIAYKYIINIV